MLKPNIRERARHFVARALSALLLSGLLPLPAAAHDRYHTEFYSNWLTREGISCCNAKDCQPIDDANVRIRNEVVEVYVEGEWVPVAPEKIRPLPATRYAQPSLSYGQDNLLFRVRRRRLRARTSRRATPAIGPVRLGAGP
jgi:hypothetical protein